MTVRDDLLATKISLLQHHVLHVFHDGEHRTDLYVTFKVSTLAEKYGDITLAEVLKKFRSRRTGKWPSRISFVHIDRNGDQAESWCVFP